MPGLFSGDGHGTMLENDEYLNIFFSQVSKSADAQWCRHYTRLPWGRGSWDWRWSSWCASWSTINHRYKQWPFKTCDTLMIKNSVKILIPDGAENVLCYWLVSFSSAFSLVSYRNRLSFFYILIPLKHTANPGDPSSCGTPHAYMSSSVHYFDREVYACCPWPIMEGHHLNIPSELSLPYTLHCTLCVLFPFVYLRVYVCVCVCVCVLTGCGGCVTTWSTYATLKCASWWSLPWAASLWQPRTPCKQTHRATTWVRLTSRLHK